MTRRRIAPLATAALLGLAGGASGQVTGSLDVGAGTYRPDRSIPGGIASIAPTLAYERQGLQLGQPISGLRDLTHQRSLGQRRAGDGHPMASVH